MTARNATIDELRRRRRTRSLSLFESEGVAEEFYTLPPAIGEDPEQAALSVEIAQLVWTAARGLNDNDYALLDLNLRKGLDPQELAQELNTSIGNVYTRLSRLKRSLEESVTALLLAQMGRRQCAQLDQLLQGTEITEGIRARTRRKVTTHIGECSTCLANRGRYISAALTFGSLAPVLPVATVKANVLAGITSYLMAVGTGTATASGVGVAGAAGWPSQLWQTVSGTWNSLSAGTQAMVATVAVASGVGIGLAALVILSSLGPDPMIQPAIKEFQIKDNAGGNTGFAIGRQLSVDLAIDLEEDSPDIIGWLLAEETDGPIPPVDAYWSPQAPESLLLSPGDGLKRLNLWIKDGDGGVHHLASGNIFLDTTEPRDPENASSPTHDFGVPNTSNRVGLSWLPIEDPGPGSGIAGYSIVWDQSPRSVPDGKVELAPEVTETLSPPLDIGNWFFHLSTVDLAGNKTATIHLGPFLIAVTVLSPADSPNPSPLPTEAPLSPIATPTPTPTPTPTATATPTPTPTPVPTPLIVPDGDSDGPESPATVNVTVNPVNDLPVASAQTATTDEGVPVTISLTGSDAETAFGDLNFKITQEPVHGTLSVTGSGTSDWTYTPDLYFSGVDRFKFTVTDRGDPDGCQTGGPGCYRALTSPETTVDINIIPGVLITDITVESGSTYELDEIGDGIKLYTDRDYTFADVPDHFQGQDFIRTANDDKAATHLNFLRFILHRDAVVYIAYDDRVDTLPGWLDRNWSLTTDIIETTDVPHRVFRRELPAGPVQLGGNAVPPMGGADSNYLVIAIPVTNSSG